MAVENAALTTVGEIRTQYRFVVPEYQRGYAWTKDQWKDLWEDALSAMRRTHSDHFAGSLMIRGRGPGARPEVVDGQQRLTSISLLLHALGHPGFDLEFQNNEALQTYFDYFARGKISVQPRLGQYRSFYARNMQDAAGYFSERAEALPQDERERVAAVLLERFQLFVLQMTPAFDVHVAFETINNRGKPLSVLEKLKNRLIYLCSTAQDQEAGRAAAQEVHTAWKGIYHWLGKGHKLLGDDAFLRAHAVGWFRTERRADWLKTQLFDEEFSANSHAVAPREVVAYVGSLERLACWWYYLNHPGDLPPNAAKALRSLERTASTGAKGLLLWALARSAAVDDQLTSDPKASAGWVVPFTQLVEQAERFSVLVLYGNDRLGNTGQSDFHRSAYALAHPGVPVNPRTPVPPAGHPEAVEFAAAYMKSLIDNWRLEDFDNAEAEYLDPRFQDWGYFEPKKMRTVIADRLRGSDGYYNWIFGKLLVYEWEEQLRGTKGLPERKSWETFSWDESVEHIYPQNPVSGWAESISLDGRSPDRLRKSVFNSIGNLLLLSKSRNASVSNNLYFGSVDPAKDKHARFSSGSYSELQVAKCCPDRWTVAAIAARGIAMMRFAQRRWQFRLVHDDSSLTEWLPILFGDSAERIREGAASHGVAIDGRALRTLVDKFEKMLPG